MGSNSVYKSTPNNIPSPYQHHGNHRVRGRHTTYLTGIRNIILTSASNKLNCCGVCQKRRELYLNTKQAFYCQKIKFIFIGFSGNKKVCLLMPPNEIGDFFFQFFCPEFMGQSQNKAPGEPMRHTKPSIHSALYKITFGNINIAKIWSQKL